MSLPRRTLTIFSGPGLPLAAIGLPMIVYLPPYYASELGLGLVAVGLLFPLVRLLDMPLDPLLGHLIDRTRSRHGRFRPWLVAGALIIAVAAALVFFAKPGLPPWQAFAQLMLLYVGFSMLMLAQFSWAACLSDNYDERSRIYGWIQAGAVVGLILTLTLPPLMGALGRTEASAGVHAMGWFLIVIAPATALLLAWAVPEPACPPAARPKATWAELKALAANPLIRRLLVIDALQGIAPGITGGLFLFYFEHKVGFPAAQASLLLLVYFVAGLAAAPLWMKLAYRIGKHRAAAAAGVLYIVTHASLWLLPGGLLWSAILGMALAGLPYTAFPFLLRAMLADVCDTDRLATGLDRTGLLQAVLVTTSKIAHAAPVAIIYPILAAIGFNPTRGGTNTQEAVDGMAALFILGPALIMLLAVWVVARWPHDERAHGEVQAALAARGS